jgi:polyketide biosynthesis enoyl-CoA hydratase PksI
MMFTGKRFKGSELARKSTNINYILPKKEIINKAEDIAWQISENNIKSIYLLKNTLSAKKKKLLIEARQQEDLMHKISFAFPETREAVEEFYAGKENKKLGRKIRKNDTNRLFRKISFNHRGYKRNRTSYS